MRCAAILRLFARQDSIEAAWRIVDDVIEFAQRDDAAPLTYREGSWGPTQADSLATDAGGWHNPGVGC